MAIDTLCNNHNENVYDIECIMKYVKTMDISYKDKTYIYNMLQNIKNRTKHCKKLGQRLENRCRKYRYAIESLGFERIKQ